VATRVGVQVAGTTPADRIAPIAREVEQLGFGELWLAEDFFDLGGMSSVAVALGATKRIPVGLGIASIRVRHPALTAMEFATLAGAHPGRFLAGLGHGVTAWMEQMGLRPPSVIRSLREGTVAVRRLLDGEELTEEGEYASFDAVRLSRPPTEHIPIYHGVHGPRSLELAGEVADGTLLGWFSSPEYVTWARERIDAGRARAGRQDPHPIVALCIASVSDEDPRAARAELAGWASRALTGVSKSTWMQATDAGTELAEAVAARSSEEEVLPDEVLDRFAAFGDLAACESMVGRLLDAGADRVVLVPNPEGVRSTEAMVEQMRRAASIAV
jgi:alkanesulfonate monooxygenase SsuD/methylene tetrahydromethanopterin reductase-like flavin-dependent oxidoreductase (luciferase family)